MEESEVDYEKLGFSKNSQELICSLYKLMRQNNNQDESSGIKVLEEFLFSFIEDIQTREHKIKKLEDFLKKEKKDNEENLRLLAEEAEQQLALQIDLVRSEEQQKLAALKCQHKNEMDLLLEKIKMLEETEFKQQLSEKKDEQQEQDHLQQNLPKSSNADDQWSTNTVEDEELTQATHKAKHQTPIVLFGNEPDENDSEIIDKINTLDNKLNDIQDILHVELEKIRSKLVDLNASSQSPLETNDFRKRSPSVLFKSLQVPPAESERRNSQLLRVRQFSIDDNLRAEVDRNNAQHSNGFETISLSASSSIQRKSSNRELMMSSVKSPERIFKILLVGDAGVGKTSFIMRFCHNEFNANIRSTLGIDFQMKTLRVDDEVTTVQLWDTCGQERYRSLTRSYFRRADGIVLMYDCTNELTFLNVREWMNLINEQQAQILPTILVANKVDLRTSKVSGVVRLEDGLRLSREYGVMFVETSAKDDVNITKCLNDICRAMKLTQIIEQHSQNVLSLSAKDKKAKCC